MNIPATVTAYIDDAPPERAARLRALAAHILQRYPSLRASLRYRMPTFESDAGWIAIASQKHYLSVYTCARQHIEPYLALHPGTKSGTGCLNFPDRTEIDLIALDAVIDSALNAKAGAPPPEVIPSGRPKTGKPGRQTAARRLKK